MNLTATTHTLEVVTGSAVATHYLACWTDVDKSGAATDVLPGSSQGNITTATDTTVVAAPGASVYRTITGLVIRNAGVSDQTVTVNKDVSGTEYSLWSGSLGAGEVVEYTKDTGWNRLAASGAVETSSTSGSVGASDVSTSTASFGGILDSGDSTVQAALDTIDDHTHAAPAASTVTVVTTAFGAVLTNDADSNTVQKCLDKIDDHTHSAPAASTVTVVTTAFAGVLTNDGNSDTVQECLDKLDDHTHSAPAASAVSVVTTAFAGVLTNDGNSDTVQECLDKIDDHTHAAPAASAISVVTTAFAGVLTNDGNSDTVQECLDKIDDHDHVKNGYFTLSNPGALYDLDSQVPMFHARAALTIARVRVDLNTTSYEIDANLKFADDLNSFANATLICAIDTSSGTANITSFTDATVPSGKYIYVEFDADPNAAITFAHIGIEWEYD